MSKKDPPPAQKKNPRTTWIRWLAVALGVAPIVGAIALRVLYATYNVPAGSMLPTIAVGDHIFVRRGAGIPPERGEIVVFAFPEDPTKDFVKRAIALPGDELLVLDHRPIVNGFPLKRCYVGPMSFDGHSEHLYVEHLGARSYGIFLDERADETACQTATDCGPEKVCKAGMCGTTLQGPWVVPAGEVWVMGDNRNNSFDSRAWRGGLGAGVPFDNIHGSARSFFLSGNQTGELSPSKFGSNVQGPPLLRENSPLQPELTKCLSSRPPASETTPPSPGSK